MKPLLPVTGQEEKISLKEKELEKYKDNFEKQKADYEEIERRYAQIIEEKSILAEQVQASEEVAAEAEEVRQGFCSSLDCLIYCGIHLTTKFKFIFMYFRLDGVLHQRKMN